MLIRTAFYPVADVFFGVSGAFSFIVKKVSTHFLSTKIDQTAGDSTISKIVVLKAFFPLLFFFPFSEFFRSKTLY